MNRFPPEVRHGANYILNPERIDEKGKWLTEGRRKLSKSTSFSDFILVQVLGHWRLRTVDVANVLLMGRIVDNEAKLKLQSDIDRFEV